MCPGSRIPLDGAVSCKCIHEALAYKVWLCVSPARMGSDAYEDRDAGRGVDLRLAENYLPACFCIAKGVLLALCLYAAETRGSGSFVVGIGLGLVLDRVYCTRRIFDGNLLLLCAYVSRTAALVGGHVDGMDWALPGACLRALYFVWFVLACLGMLPRRLDSGVWGGLRGLLGQGRTSELWHVYLWYTCVCVCGTAFAIPSVEDGPLLGAVRIVAYVVMSVLWVYAVGLRQRGVLLVSTEGCLVMVCMYSAVLYLSAWMGGVLCAWGLWCIVRRDSWPDVSGLVATPKYQPMADDVEAPPEVPVVVPEPRVVEPHVPIDDLSDTAGLMEQFRLAREAREAAKRV